MKLEYGMVVLFWGGMAISFGSMVVFNLGCFI